MKHPLSLEVAEVLLTLHPNQLDPMREPRKVLTESGEIQISELTVKHSKWTETRKTIDGKPISVTTVTPKIFCQLHTDLTRYASRPKHILRLPTRTDHSLANAAD